MRFNRDKSYKLPLFYRFNTDGDFVERSTILETLDMSLQDILSNFMRYEMDVDFTDLTTLHPRWCVRLSDYLAKHECRLINPSVRIISYTKSQNTLYIEIAGQLYDKTVYTTQLQIMQ